MRLLAFPFVLWALYIGQEPLFAWLICLSLVTDILDGWIARRFDLQTDFGARLDSIADMGTYIGAVAGIFVFKAVVFEPYLPSFLVFIGLWVFAHLLALIKFGRFPSLHLYSWKIGGYIQGFFFFTLFAVAFFPSLYYIMIIWGIAAFLEHILLQLMMPEMESNAKGLWWYIKAKGG
jgi:CDP-diacylglycerol--glycerol-3-phosphate 3-phosphatidyltransferase